VLTEDHETLRPVVWEIAAGGDQWQEGRRQVPSRSAHGREPEPLDEILDGLADIQAVYSGNDESAQAAFGILRQRLEGRADAMVPPLKLASLIVDEAGKRGLRYQCRAGGRA
jgi:hypothetical protein